MQFLQTTPPLANINPRLQPFGQIQQPNANNRNLNNQNRAGIRSIFPQIQQNHISNPTGSPLGPRNTPNVNPRSNWPPGARMKGANTRPGHMNNKCW